MDQNIPNYTPTPQISISPIEPEQAKKNSSPIIYFALISTVVVVVFTGIILFQSSQNTNSKSLKTTSIVPSAVPTIIVTPIVQAKEIFPVESVNLFVEEETYENPFEDSEVGSDQYQNPFEQQ